MTGRRDDLRDLDGPPDSAGASLAPGPSVLERGRDLAGLSVAGITRRRIAILMAALLSAWIVLALSRQVGEAADAASQAIQDQAYIEIEARARGLGGRDEHPFSLAPGAPSLPPDAPGSASAALGAPATQTAPIDAWLDLLFGSGH
jgi:hypothetical protein